MTHPLDIARRQIDDHIEIFNHANTARIYIHEPIVVNKQFMRMYGGKYVVVSDEFFTDRKVRLVAMRAELKGGVSDDSSSLTDEEFATLRQHRPHLTTIPDSYGRNLTLVTEAFVEAHQGKLAFLDRPSYPIWRASSKFLLLVKSMIRTMLEESKRDVNIDYHLYFLYMLHSYEIEQIQPLMLNISVLYYLVMIVYLLKHPAYPMKVFFSHYKQLPIEQVLMDNVSENLYTGLRTAIRETRVILSQIGNTRLQARDRALFKLIQLAIPTTKMVYFRRLHVHARHRKIPDNDPFTTGMVSLIFQRRYANNFGKLVNSQILLREIMSDPVIVPFMIRMFPLVEYTLSTQQKSLELFLTFFMPGAYLTQPSQQSIVAYLTDMVAVMETEMRERPFKAGIEKVEALEAVPSTLVQRGKKTAEENLLDVDLMEESVLGGLGTRSAQGEMMEELIASESLFVDGDGEEDEGDDDKFWKEMNLDSNEFIFESQASG